MSPLRALLVTSLHWASTTRLGAALMRSGFTVAAAGPFEHGLRHVTGLAAYFPFDPYRRMVTSVGRVLRDWPADIVIPADDAVVACLHRLHDALAQKQARSASRIVSVIRRSLGHPDWYEAARKKSALVTLASSEGLQVPRTFAARDFEEARRLLALGGFPLVLKLDGSSGGAGVRIVVDQAEGQAAFRDLARMVGRWSAGKQSIKCLSLAPLASYLRDGHPTIAIQDYIDGIPANRAVACRDGEVLAGQSVEVIRSNGATGPATVVRSIEHPEMAWAARHLVKRLELSGLVGFDFMIERATGRAYLIEMNPRPTQISHFSHDIGDDLCAALFCGFSGKNYRRSKPALSGPIALYPQELWRDPNSEYLRGAVPDMPVDRPEILNAYAHPVPEDPPTWLDAVQRYLRPGETVAPPVEVGPNFSLEPEETS